MIRDENIDLSKLDYFGPILALSAKILTGERPENSDYKNAVRLNLEKITAVHDSEEAAKAVSEKTNELVTAAYNSLMSHRKEFLKSGAITGEEENKKLVDHLPSAFIFRPFMNPPGYEGTEMAGKVYIRGAHYEQ